MVHSFAWVWFRSPSPEKSNDSLVRAVKLGGGAMAAQRFWPELGAPPKKKSIESISRGTAPDVSEQYLKCWSTPFRFRYFIYLCLYMENFNGSCCIHLCSNKTIALFPKNQSPKIFLYSFSSTIRRYDCQQKAIVYQKADFILFVSFWIV